MGYKQKKKQLAKASQGSSSSGPSAPGSSAPPAATVVVPAALPAPGAAEAAVAPPGAAEAAVAPPGAAEAAVAPPGAAEAAVAPPGAAEAAVAPPGVAEAAVAPPAPDAPGPANARVEITIHTAQGFRLFLQNARQQHPSFVLTVSNAVSDQHFREINNQVAEDNITYNRDDKVRVRIREGRHGYYAVF